MELVVRKNDLLKELSLLQGIVERKNTIPILANVLIEAADGVVSLLATDLDVALLDAEDKPVARDTTKEPQATVRACPEAAGRYTLVVKMAAGAGDFVAATWSTVATTSSMKASMSSEVARKPARSWSCSS